MELFFDGDDAAAWDGRNSFTTFVLSTKSYTLAKLRTVNAELASDPTAASELLQSQKCSALLLSDFPERVERILTWLHALGELTRPNQSKDSVFLTDIIHGFASSLVIPLLHPAYSEYHTSRGFADLVTITTRLSYVFRKRGVRPETHKVLLEKVSSNRHLLRSILPSVDGAKLIQKLLAEAQAGAEIQALGSATTLTEWITVAVELCSRCSGNHGVHAELAKWNALLELRDSLTKILLAENERRCQSSKGEHIDEGKMRVLSKEEKKSGMRCDHAAPKLSHYLSRRDLENLELFNMGIPTGIGPLEGVLTRLRERESFSLFHTFVKSFPCALCLRYGHSVTGTVPFPQKMPRKLFSTDSLPTSFTTTLFGERLGPWRICLAEQALKDLSSADKEGYLSAIARRLKELATGQWELKSLRLPLSPKMREECGGSVPVPLWRAIYSSNGRILWQINVGYDEEYDVESQVITVWRIGTADEIRGYIRQVLREQKMYTASHVQRCCLQFDNFPLLPKQYLCGNPADARCNASQIDGSAAVAPETLLSNKFYFVTGKVLDCLFSASDRIEFPFDMSREEIEIVKYSNSAAFILGRSGTGKTTCLLFKLLCRNIASRAEQAPVRQIFLTRSSYLAEQLKDYLKRLIDSQLGNPAMPTEIKRGAPREYVLREARDPLEGETLDTLRGDKFPLVCTFDQLFGFLEKVIKLNDRNNFVSATAYGLSIMPWDRRERRLINYHVFSTQYWKKRFHHHKDRLEPDVVLAEILGIIKGSTSAEREFRPLSRDEYLEMSTRKANVVTDHITRNAVYNMYQDYERQKRSFGDRDDIDRVIQLLKSLEKDQGLKNRVQALLDEVYVDEVQDNKLLELDLLFTLVRNPYGIHCAGDTAQCISRDNTFRFQDIKARFYRHFVKMATDAGKLSLAKPKLFPLVKNYRSHQGILSLAANIVEMLCNGFPGQIDVLPQEVGNYPGPKPTIFSGFDDIILPHSPDGILKPTEASSSFGAEQVIIVRNDSVKEELKKVLGSTLILTVYQSKGLEFEDVMLYNFFSNSIWDNVPLPTLELLLTKQAAGWLDKSKYASLCSELKHLYVAITRARKNLWIVEDTRSFVQNIGALWTSTKQGREPLVSLVDVNDPEAKEKVRAIIKLGKSTTLEAWRDRGEMLLQQALYEEALLCFQRANYKQGENLATAHLLYEAASRLDVGASSEQTLHARETFAKAAQIFEDSSFIQTAAETWGAARQYRRAAEVLRVHEEYGKAALWYERVNDFLQAAECYHLAKRHDEAVKAYRKGDHFTELVGYLGKYQEYISDPIKTRYSTLINLLLQRGDLPEALLPAALETLGDDNAKENFYKKFERTEDLLAFYIERKRYNDSFKLALSEGKFEDAVRTAKESRVARDPEGYVSEVPPGDLITLYNGVMAGYTWSSIQFDLNNLSEAKVSPAFKPPNHAIPALGKNTVPELRGPSSGWEEILDCIQSTGGHLQLIRQRQNIYYEKFFEEFGDDFLDLVEFLRLDANPRHKIFQGTDMAQLPVGTMQKFASLAGDLLNKRKPPTNLVISIGGLVFSHLQNQVMILGWSPLFPIVSGKVSTSTHQQGGNHVVVKCEQTYDALTGWLVPIVARIIPCALVQMHSLLVGRVQGPCFVALQGSCPKQPHICKSRHTRLPSEEIRTYIMSLLDAAGLSCASERLYHHHKLQESDSKLYLGNRRAFLETLLRELTFISPLLNDHEMQQEVWGTILAENGKWPHVRDGLASLFFYRLRRKEWEKRGTVSALLEERSFANRLGVMPRFLQFLQSKTRAEGWEKFTFISACNDLQPTAVARYDASTLVNRIERVLERIQDLIIHQSYQPLQSFVSVLSLYEFLSLELINRTQGVELLVPRSRQQCIRDITQTPYPSYEERYRLERCVVTLLGSLCDILKGFATEYWRLKSQKDYAKQHGLDSNSNPEGLFYACGKPLWDGNRYMMRRSLDHLTLCMINMGVGRRLILPMGYNNLRHQIQQAYERWEFLNPPTLVSWKDPFTPEQIAVQFANVYRNYNKEELLIIGAAKSSPRFEFLSGLKLRKVVVGEQQRTLTTGSPTTVRAGQMLEVHDEVPAASKIVKWWRRCSTRLQARRAHAQKRAETLSRGPEGQAEVMIDDITAHWMTSRYRQQRNILRDHGVSLLSGILKLKELVELTYSKAMKALTAKGGECKLSSMAVEGIQDMVAGLERRRVALEKNEAIFAKEVKARVLIEMPVTKLEGKMNMALTALVTCEQEVTKWGKDIEDCLQEAQMY